MEETVQNEFTIETVVLRREVENVSPMVLIASAEGLDINYCI